MFFDEEPNMPIGTFAPGTCEPRNWWESMYGDLSRSMSLVLSDAGGVAALLAVMLFCILIIARTQKEERQRAVVWFVSLGAGAAGMVASVIYGKHSAIESSALMSAATLFVLGALCIYRAAGLGEKCP